MFISTPVKLSTKNEQLVITNEQETMIPIEDINSIVIDELSIVITGHALQKCTESNVAVFLCNSKHLPSTIALPLNNYHRQLKILQQQTDVSKPIQKKIWQQIIKKKIYNQAMCLRISNRDGSDKLFKMVDWVMSGDTNNTEAVAAAYYFKALFGDDYTRSDECLINAGLNYGYAIIRGLIARSLVAHGFEPCIGIFHKNQLNNFNLADDLIEPFRPLVDLYVSQNFTNYDSLGLNREHKLGLYNLVSFSVISGNEKHSTSYAIERLVSSLYNCYSKLNDKLILPTLMPLELHEYE